MNDSSAVSASVPRGERYNHVWRPPVGRLGRDLFDRRWLAVVMSLLSVVVLLVPTNLFSVAEISPHFTSHPSVGGSLLDASPSASQYIPYYLPARLFPGSDNLTGPANFSLPKVAPINVGSAADVLMLEGERAGNQGRLAVQLGIFNVTNANAIWNSTSCPSHGAFNDSLAWASCTRLPLQWSAPITVASFATPVTADAVAVNGSFVVVAGSTSGMTSLYTSSDYGGHWTIVPGAPLSGSITSLSTSSTIAFASLVSGSTLNLDTITLSTGSPRTFSVGSVQNSTATLLPTGGEVAFASLLPSHLIVYYSSTNGGQTFTSKAITSFNASSYLSQYNTIGGTRINSPGGKPGQVALATNGSEIFVMFSTILGNRVGLGVEESGNNGSSWAGPYYSAPSLGGVQDPSVQFAPSGQVYATWRDTASGGWQIEQAVYSADGRLIVPPSPVPGSQIDASHVPTSVSSIVGSDYRSFIAWSSITGTGPELRYSGEYPTLPVAAAMLKGAIDSLGPADFTCWKVDSDKGCPTNWQSQKSTLESEAATVQADVTAHNANGASSMIATTMCPQIAVGVLQLRCNLKTLAICPPPHSSSSLILSGGTGPLSASGMITAVANYALLAAGRVGFSNNVPPCPNTGLPGPVTQILANGATITLTPVVLNPSQALLNISNSFPVTDTTTTKCLATGHIFTGGCVLYQTWKNISEVTNYQFTVGVGQSRFNLIIGTFSSASNLTGIYLTHLIPGVLAYWRVTVVATYQETDQFCQYKPSCDWTKASSTVSTWQVSSSAIWGNVTTQEGVYPYPLLPQTNTNPGTLYFAWNNSVLANGQVSMSPGGSVSSSAHSPSQILGYSGRGYGSYSYTVTAQSTAGSSQTTGNVLSEGGPSSNPVSTSSYHASFTYTTNPIRVWGIQAAGINATNATVTWYANSVSYNGSGAYYEVGTGVNISVASLSGWKIVGANTSYLFRAELRGLSPWSVYSFRGLSYATIGGMTYSAPISMSFATVSVFNVTEQDLPYDSIAKTGGGADLWWDMPISFAKHSAFANGTIRYAPILNLSHQINVTFFTSPGLSNYPGSFLYNLSGLVPNTSYALRIDLNFTAGSSTIKISSSPISFTYLLDTSGDGLTDSEKSRGWTVATTDVNGGNHLLWSTADPKKRATNGLISDYVAKEYGLSATYFDTAGSHMIDTWNLTFDLGSATSYAQSPWTPFGTQLWNAGGTYNFQYACQTPVPGPCSFAPKYIGLNNLSDNSPWASTVLWSSNALYKLSQMIWIYNNMFDWIRGTTGSFGYYDSHQVWHANATVTLWGKLSWGANPLAASSIDDGYPDGSRLNPLFREDLQFGLYQNQGFGASLMPCSSTITPVGTGYAVSYYVNDSDNAATNEFTGYSAQAFAGSSCIPPNGLPGTIPAQTLTIPVDNTVQFQNITFAMVANNSTGSSPSNIPVATYGCYPSWSPPVMVNMFNPPLGAASQGQATAACAGMANGTVNYFATAVPAGLKVPTYLWAPNNNTTLTNLPWGLKRYQGDQAFNLLIVNASSAITSDQFRYPLSPNARNQVLLGKGLNALVVPWGEFLNSTFGTSVLENRTIPSTSTSQWLTGGGDETTLLNQGYSLPLSNLACYWKDRSLLNAPYYNAHSVFLCPSPGSGGGTYNGFTVASGQGMQILDSTSCSSGNCGGVPTNPSLAPGVSIAAVQTVVMLNVSSQAELDLLLASLLDNATGGVNGTFINVTTELPTLGLPSALLTALPNMTLPGSGDYAYPTSVVKKPNPPPPPPPPPPPFGLVGQFFNDVGGAIENFAQSVANAIRTVAVAVWNSATAIANYAQRAVAALAAVGEVGLAAVSKAIDIVGQAILSALQAFVAALIALAKSIYSLVIQPIKAGLSGFTGCFHTALNNVLTALSHFVSSAGGIGNVLSNVGNISLCALGGMTFSQPLMNGISQVMSVLQPVLNLLNPMYLVQLIGSLLGRGTILSALNAVTNTVAGAVGTALTVVFSAISSMAGLLGFGGTTAGQPLAVVRDHGVSPKAAPDVILVPFSGAILPTSGQLHNFVMQFGNYTGLSILTNLIGGLSALPEVYQTFTQSAQLIVDVIVLVVAIMILFYALKALPTGLGMLNLFNQRLFGVTMDVAQDAAAVPYGEMAFMGLGLGLDLATLVSAPGSPNDFWWSLVGLGLVVIPYLLAKAGISPFKNKISTGVPPLETVELIMNGVAGGDTVGTFCVDFESGCGL